MHSSSMFPSPYAGAGARYPHLIFCLLSDTQGQGCLLWHTLGSGSVSFKLMCTWSGQLAQVWPFLLSTSDLSGKVISALATAEL